MKKVPRFLAILLFGYLAIIFVACVGPVPNPIQSAFKYLMYPSGTIDGEDVDMIPVAGADINTVRALDIKPLSTDPGFIGKWSDPYDLPSEAIHLAMRPDYSIMAFGRGAAPNQPWPSPENPIGVSFWKWENKNFSLKYSLTRIFCSMTATDMFGNTMVYSGHISKEGEDGTEYVEKWMLDGSILKMPNLLKARWYPNVSRLANGEHFISGGSDRQKKPVFQPEIYSPQTGTSRLLTGANPTDIAQLNNIGNPHWYSYLVNTPSGEIAKFGPEGESAFINTTGQGAWKYSNTFPRRENGSYAQLKPGVVLRLGGRPVTPAGIIGTLPGTSTGEVINTDNLTLIKPIAPMYYPRLNFFAITLPNGKIIAINGNTGAGNNWKGFDDSNQAQLYPEIYDLKDNSWSIMAKNPWNPQYQSQVCYVYHNVAMLLPDGSVLNTCGQYDKDDGLLTDKQVRTFFPPYFFKKDGSGTMTAPPIIRKAPSVVSVSKKALLVSMNTMADRDSVIDTSGVRAEANQCMLIALPNVTHSVNSAPQVIPCGMSISSEVTNGIEVDLTGIRSINDAPPGHYYLFILNKSGRPGGYAKTAWYGQTAEAPIIQFTP